MGTKIHGEGHVVAIGGTDVCDSQATLQQTRDIVEATTSCDATKVYLSGKKDHTVALSGPLEFGAGSTEATLTTAFDDDDGVTWEIDPDGSGTAGAGNPIRSGSLLVRSLNFTFGISGPITYDFQGQGISAVTRDVTP